MTKTHEIKLLVEFADAVFRGEKKFEVRKNDRGYQKGDRVRFRVVDAAGINVDHPLNDCKYKITYVMSGWGIKNDYVVFGITEIT